MAGSDTQEEPAFMSGSTPHDHRAPPTHLPKLPTSIPSSCSRSPTQTSTTSTTLGHCSWDSNPASFSHPSYIPHHLLLHTHKPPIFQASVHFSSTWAAAKKARLRARTPSSPSAQSASGSPSSTRTASASSPAPANMSRRIYLRESEPSLSSALPSCPPYEANRGLLSA